MNRYPNLLICGHGHFASDFRRCVFVISSRLSGDLRSFGGSAAAGHRRAALARPVADLDEKRFRAVVGNG
jgi:hypothetical protein